MPIKVLHILPSLSQSGIVQVLANIIQYGDSHVQHELLVTNETDNSVQDQFRQLHIPIYHSSQLNEREIRTLFQNANVIDIMHPKLTILGGLQALIARKPCIWGVHHTKDVLIDNPMNRFIYSRLGHVAVRRLADRVICCSPEVKTFLLSKHWPAEKISVITNGIDTSKFKKSESARIELRNTLDIPQNAVVIGLAASYTDAKDIPNFIKAAHILKEGYTDRPLYFMMCGEGMDAHNKELAISLEKAGLMEHTRLLGTRTDMPDVFSAMDILASSSKSEALSMALLEGTACGCLIAATNVGEHAVLMEKIAGACVPSSQPEALADALKGLLSLSPEHKRQRIRHGISVIENEYGARKMAARYEALYENISQNAGKELAIARGGP